MRNVAAVVEERLDRRGVDDFEAHDLAAEVVAGIDRHAVKGEVLPCELGEPLGPAAIAVDVGVLPELLEVVNVLPVGVPGDLRGLGVADVLLCHDLADRLA